MKTLISLGIVLSLAAPALADPYQSSIRSKQVDAHEMRDVRNQTNAASTQGSASPRTEAFVAEYRPAGSKGR